MTVSPGPLSLFVIKALAGKLILGVRGVVYDTPYAWRVRLHAPRDNAKD